MDASGGSSVAVALLVKGWWRWRLVAATGVMVVERWWRGWGCNDCRGGDSGGVVVLPY